MTRNPLIASLATLALLVAPAAAQDFRAVNRMIVTPMGDGRFEVSGKAELWARDYWCAAGDYARRVLDLPVTARLVVSQPYDKRTRSVVFVPDPDADPAFGVVVLGLSIRNAGSSLSVGQARGYCADRHLRRG